MEKSYYINELDGISYAAMQSGNGSAAEKSHRSICRNEPTVIKYAGLPLRQWIKSKLHSPRNSLCRLIETAQAASGFINIFRKEP